MGGVADFAMKVDGRDGHRLRIDLNREFAGCQEVVIFSMGVFIDPVPWNGPRCRCAGGYRDQLQRVGLQDPQLMRAGSRNMQRVLQPVDRRRRCHHVG